MSGPEIERVGAATQPTPTTTAESANTLSSSNNSAERPTEQGLIFSFRTFTRRGMIAFENFMAPRLAAEDLIIIKGLEGAEAQKIEREAWRQACAIGVRLRVAVHVTGDTIYAYQAQKSNLRRGRL